MSSCRKHWELRAAVRSGVLRVGQRLLPETVFPGSEMDKLGMDLTSQTLQTNASCSTTWEHVRELLCLYWEVLALEKAGCCQTSITDVLCGERACRGLHPLRACPLSSTASCFKSQLIFRVFPSCCSDIADICCVSLQDKEIKAAGFVNLLLCPQYSHPSANVLFFLLFLCSLNFSPP